MYFKKNDLCLYNNNLIALVLQNEKEIRYEDFEDEYSIPLEEFIQVYLLGAITYVNIYDLEKLEINEK